MLGLAVRSGFDRVATGHYAAIGRIGGRLVLCEPAEERKSQVYFLALIRPEVLDRLEFPLEGIRKRDAKRIAEGLDIEVRQDESSTVRQSEY